MPTKKITVEHPEAHQAPHGALDKAAKEAEVPDGYTVVGYVNTSGDKTVYELSWGEDGDEKAEAEVSPAEPTRRGRKA